jgi:hypothetical protein
VLRAIENPACLRAAPGGHRIEPGPLENPSRADDQILAVPTPVGSTRCPSGRSALSDTTGPRRVAASNAKGRGDDRYRRGPWLVAHAPRQGRPHSIQRIDSGSGEVFMFSSAGRPYRLMVGARG